MGKITKFLTSIEECIKLDAKIKVLRTSMDKAIAEAEEEVATVECDINLFQMKGSPQEMLNDYMDLKMKLLKAQRDLEFKKEVKEDLFGE